MCLVIAMTGQGSGTSATVAWAYVGLRVIHSIWQATVNKVPVRFLLFIISTFALLFLGIRAVIATLLADPSALPV